MCFFQYFTSAEIYQSQSRSTFDDEDFQDANGCELECDLVLITCQGFSSGSLL